MRKLRATGIPFVLAALLSLIQLPAYSQNSAPGPFADDTIILTTAKNANKDRVTEMVRGASCTVRTTIHMEADNFDLLYLNPGAGRADAAYAALDRMKDNNVRSVGRNMLYKMSQVAPSDPSYTSQWNLMNPPGMNWQQAYSELSASQNATPALVVCDTGLNRDQFSSELPGWIQYNATANPPVLETPVDVQGHGTACVSESGATSNNGLYVAGPSSLKSSLPPKGIMMRITTAASPSSSSTTTISSAIAFIVNNYSTLFGHAVPISISFGSSSSPLWNDSTVKSLACTWASKGGDLCLAAGNDAMTMTSIPPSNISVVQATDRNGDYASFSNRITGYPVAAPGVSIASLTTSCGCIGSWSGTSMATPQWAGVEALITSINPAILPFQAKQIMLNTGTPEASGAVKIPNVYAAVQAAQSASAMTPPACGGTSDGGGGTGGGGGGGGGKGRKPTK